MVESFLLGGRVIRELVLDPLLPEPIVPDAERDALVAAHAPLRPRSAAPAGPRFLERHGVLGAPHARRHRASPTARRRLAAR